MQQFPTGTVLGVAAALIMALLFFALLVNRGRLPKPLKGWRTHIPGINHVRWWASPTFWIGLIGIGGAACILILVLAWLILSLLNGQGNCVLCW